MAKTRMTAIGLFKLLREFAQHSARPVLDVNDFEDVLWLADVPKIPACYSRSWGPREDRAAEIWLLVLKEPEPPCPGPPEVCRPWLTVSPPFPDDDIPLLAERIPHPEALPEMGDNWDGAAAAGRDFLDLADHPEIDEQWARFLEERWAPWADEHRTWRKHHEVYAALFHMRQTLLREGERFEAVLALGLLEHRRADGRKVRRHLVTLPVNIELDSDRGLFTVAPPPDGGRARLELETLLEQHRPDSRALRALEEATEELTADPWDKEILSGFFRSFVQNMDHRGEYRPEERPLAGPTDHPVVVLAPAIVLRRRTTGSMTAMFEKILDQLEAGQEIPPGIGLLVDGSGARTSGGDTGTPGDPPTPILFPKPANDEQRQIIERLNTGLGVLVQGPPGTGKSHTIGNLVSHLLSQGRRILVTAQTPRALKVLKDKIPTSLQPLCVSALGNDRASLDILQRSVQQIIGRQALWNAEEAEASIVELRKRLDELAREMSEIDSGLRQLRASETILHEVAGGRYRGTPQRIAERVASEAEAFAWFSDVPSEPDASLEVEPRELLELIRLLRELPASRRAELALSFPSAGDVPPSEELAALVDDEREAHRRIEVCRKGGAAEDALQVLEKVPDEAAGELARSVEHLDESIVTARNRPLAWVETAVTEVLAGDDTPWVELRGQTADLIKGLSEEAHEADRNAVERADDLPLERLLADAEDLYQRLSEGKGINWLTRKLDAVIRRTSYITTEVRIGGRLCGEPATVRRLVQHLRFQRRLESLWRHWRQWSPRPVEESFTRQVSRLAENLEALDQVLAVYRALEEAKALVGRVPGLPQPAWHDRGAFQSFLLACRARVEYKRLAAIEEKLQAVESRLITNLERPDPHPITSELLKAVQGRDLSRLIELRRALLELQEDGDRLARAEEMLAQVAAQLPVLAERLRESPDDPEWESRLPQLPQAWAWACARLWLQRLHEPGRLDRLTRRSLQLRRRHLETTEELASLLAWRSFFERLTPEHHRHLAAWQQSVKRLGKGTGKHAARHRRDARQHLRQCRDAIPAWVMPLHQVYDSVTPEPEMFDVVIVDEASQCSLDSLFLLYVGRKILIVGDDEQISPTVLRFEHSEFQASVRRHLGDFALASVFQPDTSLFDLGRVWFGPSRVQLREHFRCMPEIIRFSDGLCYGNLVPLRQYPPDRLRPIVTQHVSSGYRQGSRQAIVNPPEADAVVEAIAACCADPRYKGKSMGVISLLGSAQARIIERRLLDRLDSNEIEQRRLVCGDAYSFQGDERDIMFLSMVAAPTDEAGQPLRLAARTQKTEKQRFNVAASRARDQMWLFHTPTLDDLGNPDDLRRQLLQHCLDPGVTTGAPGEPDLDELKRLAASPPQREEDPPKPFESWFEVDVYIRIRTRGFRVIPQFHVAGYRIDLVVEGGQRRLAVECDGDAWHGPERFQADLDRQRQLERAGWTFWRVRGSEFYADPGKAMKSLWSRLAELGIQPISAETYGEAATLLPGKPSDQNTSQLENGGQAAETSGGSRTSAGTRDERKTRVLDEPAPRNEPANGSGGDLGSPEDGNGAATATAGTALQEPGRPVTPKQARKDSPAWEEPSPIAKKLGASAYTRYAGDPLPDPHTAAGRAVQDGLVAIAEAEGPIVHERLLRVYAQSAGFKRTGRQIRERLNRPLAAALRQRRLIREYEAVSDTKQVAVYRTPAQNRAPLRTLGDRALQEIPPAEIGAVMRALRGKRAGRSLSDVEGFLRLVLGFYGLRRLTAGTKAYLEFVYRGLLNGQG